MQQQFNSIGSQIGDLFHRSVIATAAILFASCGLLTNTHAAVLTADLEVHLLRSVSSNWQTVTLSNNYSSAIPICTYNLQSFSGSSPNYDYTPAVVRIRNISTNTFDIRIQGWEDSTAVTADVHCLVTDSGAHTLPDGRQYEAYTVESDKTVGRSATDGGWTQSLMEDVSATITNTYTNHVVLGQVISNQDNRASVFTASDCESRTNEPYNSGHSDGICVGKHIGQIAGTRAPETIGYLVAEAGSGSVNGIAYALARGSDSIAGNNASNSGYTYTVNGNYTVGVLNQVGEDGGDGSWAVLYGSDPLSANQITLAIDEEVFAADTSRSHTKEIIDYWVFATAELTMLKQVVNDNGGSSTTTDFNLIASGADAIAGKSGDADITKATVSPGTYTLSETGPGGYLGSWSCTGTTLTGTTITLSAGDSAVCTLINDDLFVPPPEAFLTLEKIVINDNGGTALVGDFVLSFEDASGVSTSGPHGATAITNTSVLPGSYTLSETGAQGYALMEITCNGIDTIGSDGLDITDGENVVCTFINDDRGVDLEVFKSVDDSSPNAGDTVTFTIKVTNNGPNNATDVQVTDVVKAGFSYVTASMTGGSTMLETSPAGTGLEWGIASLAPNTTEVLTFKATVIAP